MQGGPLLGPQRLLWRAASRYHLRRLDWRAKHRLPRAQEWKHASARPWLAQRLDWVRKNALLALGDRLRHRRIAPPIEGLLAALDLVADASPLDARHRCCLRDLNP